MTEPTTPNSEEKLQQAEEEAKANYDKYLRAIADLDNFKKRISKEQADHLRYSQETLIKELVKVLDDFDRLMTHLPNEKSPSLKGVIEGIELVHRDFWKVLHKVGLKEVETKNKKFDPHLHEAIAQIESATEKEGTIVETHRKGYQLHERLIRPASVTIAKEKQGAKNEK